MGLLTPDALESFDMLLVATGTETESDSIFKERCSLLQNQTANPSFLRKL
jgi:hypothetical protein